MHRPTWNTAKGGATLDRAKTSHISSKALAGFLKMKVRKAGQNAPADVAARDFRRELEEREAKLSKEGDLLKSQISVSFSKVSETEVASALPVIECDWEEVPDADGRDKDDAKLGRLAAENPSGWASSDSGDEEGSSSGSSSEDEDDDEDEEAALMRELEQIKRERAAEAAEKVGPLSPRTPSTILSFLSQLLRPLLPRLQPYPSLHFAFVNFSHVCCVFTQIRDYVHRPLAT